MSKRNISIITLIIIIIILIIFLVRSSSVPIPEDKFVQLYIKLSLTNEKYKYNPPKLERETKRILEENNVTMDDVDKFIRKYKKRPERWVKLWEKINQELERLKREGSFTPP